MSNHCGLPVTRGSFIGMLVLTVVLGCGRDQKYRQHLEAGMRALRNESYERAAQHFEKAVKANPTSASAYCNLGIVYARMKETDRAIPALTMAADFESHDARPRLMLADVLREAGRWDESRDMLVKLESGLPDDPEILTHLALLEYRVGDKDKADSLLVQALAIDSKYAPALYNRAILKRDHEDEPLDALRYFSRYLVVAEDDDHIKRAKAEVQRLRQKLSDPGAPPPATSVAPDQSEPPGADVVVSRVAPGSGDARGDTEDPVSAVLSLEPKAAIANGELPSIDQKDYEQALVRLKETVRNDPGNADALWALAILYDVRFGQREQAESTYRRFSQSFPADPRAIKARSQLRPGINDTDRAGHIAEQMEVQKAWREALRQHRAGNTKAAVAQYKRVLALDGTKVEAAYNVGLAHRVNGDLPQSQRAFEQALGLAPDMVKARYMLAVVQRERGDTKAAIASARRVIVTDPSHAKTHFMLGVLYSKTGRNALSRKHFAQAVRFAPDPEFANKARTWLDRPQS